jgi:hypothetical protein
MTVRFRIRYSPRRVRWCVTDRTRPTWEARTMTWPRALRAVSDQLAFETGPPHGDGIPWIEL